MRLFGRIPLAVVLTFGALSIVAARGTEGLKPGDKVPDVKAAAAKPAPPGSTRGHKSFCFHCALT